MIVKIVLDKRRITKNGEYPVKIRFTEGKTQVYDSLGLYADPVEFDETRGLFVLANKATKLKNNANNIFIQTCIAQANYVLSDAIRKGKLITPNELKTLYSKTFKKQNKGYILKRTT